MLDHLVCGAFHHQVDGEPWSTSPISSPRKSKRDGCCRSQKKNNPYSTRGLDKFSALLASVEGKRQKIYSQMGSQNISLVRFRYENANDCVPIVVKARNKDEKDKSCELQKDKRVNTTNHSGTLDKDKAMIEPSVPAEEQVESGSNTAVAKRKMSWDVVLNELRRRPYYIPITLILILLFLAFSGRSAAIVCTSLVWYIIPVIEDSSDHSGRSSKKMKKDYAREWSGKKMTMDGGQKKYHARKQNSPKKREP